MRKIIDPPLNAAGRFLARMGITANMVTVGGFVMGMGVIPALLVFDSPLLALACVILNRVADGLDGAVARAGKPSDQGGFLDIALDFLFYSALPVAFAFWQPEPFALPALFLVYSFIGTGTSFLTYAIIAAKKGLSESDQKRGKKSIFYLGGLTEGTETIAVLIAMCIWPQYFPWFAWIFGSLCWVTTADRIWRGYKDFGPDQS